MKEVFMFKLLFVSLVFSFKALADVPAVAAATPTPEAAPAWMQFVPFAIIIGVFYFFLIRPQAKKQKETQSFISSLKVGDNVVTQSGILGRITGLAEQIATLEIANGVQIKVMRAQVLMSQSVLQAKKEGK
jgi:preprotein translocase subunit YajC